jgi:hypothetical protein
MPKNLEELRQDLKVELEKLTSTKPLPANANW